jgi:hypothetical protein
MSRQRRAIAAGLVGAALLLCADRHPVEAAPDARVTCVATARAGAFAPERSLAAVRRALRPQRLTNQGGTIRLTPRNYAVDDVAWLQLAKSQRRYLELVRAQCGEHQAEETWIVSITLTKAQLVLAPLVFLASPTEQGWRVVLQSYRTG